MRRIVSIVLPVFFILKLSGQGCLQKQLSAKLDFTIQVERYPRSDDVMDSCAIRVAIDNRLTRKPVQTIELNSPFMHSSDFDNCTNVRSYTTGRNAKAKAVDNDYGDLIVADLNFDGKEDLAIKKDSGGNGGPLYAFYLQDQTGMFVLNVFLSDEVQFFPSKIDRLQRRLTTYVHAGASLLSETIYQYDPKAARWSGVSQRLIEVGQKK